MKKFIKICLISGCILIAAGAAVTTAAFVLGANPVRIARYSEQRFNFLDDMEIGDITVEQ